MNIKGVIIALMMVFLTINIGVNSAGNEADANSEKKEDEKSEKKEDKASGKIKPDNQLNKLMEHCQNSFKAFGLEGGFANDVKILESLTLPSIDYMRAYPIFLFSDIIASKEDNGTTKINYVQGYCKYVYILLNVGYNGFFENDKIYDPNAIYDITDPALKELLSGYKDFIKPFKTSEYNAFLFYLLKHAAIKLS